MKKLLLACSALATVMSLASNAMAGDIGLAPATYDWSGGYVGVNAGAGFNNSDFKNNYYYAGQNDIDDATSGLIDDLDFSAKGNETAFTAGMLAGYNMEFSGFVLGAEADFNYLGFSSSKKNDVGDVMSQVLAPENTTATDSINYDSNWFGTVRGRLGYAFDNVLVYGTGGLAYGKMDVTQKLLASNGSESASWQGSTGGWNLGWTVGGGIEYGIDRWTIGAEYLYVDLGSYDWSAKGNVSLSDSTLQDDWSEVNEKGQADLKFSIARATVKYRF